MVKKVGKTSSETIGKVYAQCKQREQIEKSKKTGKVLGKDAISLYSRGISQVIKIKDVRIL